MLKALPFVLGLVTIPNCSDRDLVNLTPYMVFDQFSVATQAQEANRVMSAVARSYGNDIIVDPDPTARRIRRDYLVTIMSGDCMILAEGINEENKLRIRISLNVVRGRNCDSRMRAIFDESERGLLASR